MLVHNGKLTTSYRRLQYRLLQYYRRHSRRFDTVADRLFDFFTLLSFTSFGNMTQLGMHGFLPRVAVGSKLPSHNQCMVTKKKSSILSGLNALYSLVPEYSIARTLPSGSVPIGGVGRRRRPPSFCSNSPNHHLCPSDTT